MLTMPYMPHPAVRADVGMVHVFVNTFLVHERQSILQGLKLSLRDHLAFL